MYLRTTFGGIDAEHADELRRKHGKIHHVPFVAYTVHGVWYIMPCLRYDVPDSGMYDEYIADKMKQTDGISFAELYNDTGIPLCDIISTAKTLMGTHVWPIRESGFTIGVLRRR